MYAWYIQLGRLWLRRCFYWLTKRGRASLFTLSTQGQCWKVRFGTPRQHCRGFDCFKRSRALSSWDLPRFDDGKTTFDTGRRLLRDVQNLGDGAAGQFHEK